MTDQPEIDEFWLQEKAREIAERGKQSDPTACGTCRTRVAAGQQVKHDECAQRATLLEAPDQPGYEVITTMTEAEVAALPPRFHIPVFIESGEPKAWVCAVCWGDGWTSSWPCATATEYGLQVFTPQHEAQTAAKKQAARIAELEKDSDLLEALRAYGVDNWDGYDDAIQAAVAE
jgi:ferredoxin